MQYDYYYVLLLPHIAVSLAALYAEKPSSMASFAFLVGAYVFISALAVLPTIEQDLLRCLHRLTMASFHSVLWG